MAVSQEFIRRFTEVASAPAPDLAPAALLIARLEYPRLDASRYIRRLDEMGAAVAARVEACGRGDPLRCIAQISAYLFEDEGFAGNRAHYDDPRNSFLNDVLDRRTGIPITLALVYMEVARRASVRIDGVNFPGHFLLRAPARPDAPPGRAVHVIVDPFRGGVVLSEDDCRDLLRKHAGKDAAFDRRLLVRATKQQILVRMLVNLKRIYVGMRSFPQAHTLTRLLLAIDPSAMTELRDRGLLAYHLHDYPAALRDLESYLRFTSRRETGGKEPDTVAGGNREHAEIWEHVKALRRRVASLN